MASKPIKIEITGDAAKFTKATRKVEQDMEGVGGTAKKMAAALAGAFAVDKLVEVGSALFALGSDLELQNNKITTVFADQEASVRDWADGVNESFGLTETGVANLAASTADLLKPMGFTAEAAAKMSTEMVGLAPALAQWSAGQYDAAEVSEIMQKALLGETDGLKALGIAISAAEVDARALAIAQADGRDEITAQDKALAVQALIMEKSTDAQTAFAESSGSMASNSALVSARIAELKEAAAKKLVPIFAKVTDILVTKVIPGVQRTVDKLRTFSTWVSDNRDYIIGALAAVATVVVVTLGPAFVAWAVAAGAAAIATIAAAAPIIALGVAAAALGVAIVWLWKNWDEVWAKIKDITGRVVDWVGSKISGGWEAVKRTFTGLKDSAVDTFNRLKTGLATKASEIVTSVKNTIASIPDKILDLGSTFLSAGKTVGGEILSGVKDGLTSAVGFAGDVASGLWRKVKDAVNTNVIDKVNTALPNSISLGFLGSIDLPDNPIPRLFRGTDNFDGGVAMVGEMGRELVHLPNGAQVIPNRTTEAIMNGGGSTGATTINVAVQTQADSHTIAREMAWAMKMRGR